MGEGLLYYTSIFAHILPAIKGPTIFAENMGYIIEKESLFEYYAFVFT